MATSSTSTRKSGADITIVRMPLEPLSCTKPSCDAPHADRCVNLQRDECSGMLEAVNPLPIRALPLTTLPIAIVRHPSVGRIAVVKAGNRLRSVYLDNEMRPDADLGAIQGTPLNCIETDSARLLVMTTEGAVNISIDDTGRMKASATPHRYPKLHFVAASEQELRATIEAWRTHDSYNARSVSLTSTDTARLAASALEAYDAIHSMACGSGLFHQPLLARYRLSGRDGTTLFVSPPVMVAPAGGMQCMTELSASFSDDFTEIEASTLRSKVYRLRLQSCGGDTAVSVEHDNEVYRMDIEVSRQIHPVDYAARCANAIEREGTNSARLRFFLPGASVTMVPATRNIERIAEGILDRGDTVFQTVKSVYHPFAQGRDICIDIDGVNPAENVKDELSATDRLLRRAAVKADSLIVECRPPHSFSANVSAIVGDKVIWGGITPLKSSGYGVDMYASETIAEPWEGYVAVTMADGTEVCVSHAMGSTGAPISLSPLLAYPSPEASEMEIAISRGGALYCARFPMKPSASGEYSYYFEPGLMPVTLQEAEGSFEIPTANRKRVCHSETLMSAPLSDPFTPESRATPHIGEIVTIDGTDRRGMSLDYSRMRAYIFGKGGISVTSIDRDGVFISFHNLDSRGIEGVNAICSTGSDRYPTACIAGGDLIGIGTRGVATLVANTTAESICRGERRDMIWLTTADGNIAATEIGSNECFRIGGVEITETGEYHGTTLAKTGNKVYEIERGRVTGATAVEYMMKTPVASMKGKLSHRRLKAFSIDIEGEIEELRITISHRGGMIKELTLTPGMHRGSVRSVVVAPPADEIAIGIDGRVTAGCRIGRVKLVTG